jgi:hypothetical protein
MASPFVFDSFNFLIQSRGRGDLQHRRRFANAQVGLPSSGMTNHASKHSQQNDRIVISFQASCKISLIAFAQCRYVTNSIRQSSMSYLSSE